MSTTTPWDEDTHFQIKVSKSPVTVDGYAKGEPKELRCDECGASVELTKDPSPGVDELQHDRDCSQRWVRSNWWTEHLDG